MAAQSFLALVSGRLTRVFALLTSAGAGSANAIPALDATGKLDISFMPSGIGANTLSVVTSEALAAGAMVNLWNSTGLKARNADNTAAGKEVDGMVLAAVTSGGTATVYYPTGHVTGLSGLTVGNEYFLGAAGALIDATGVAALVAGNVVQQIGKADAAGTLIFDPQLPITL